MSKPTKRVVIVDDSPLMRQILAVILQESGLFEIVGSAENPIEARTIIRETNPDVITLDIEMPEMDGLSFLEKIMRLKPTPTVMISSLTTRGADVTLQALRLGAVDCIAKPTHSIREAFAEEREFVVNTIYEAACVSPAALVHRTASVQAKPLAVNKTSGNTGLIVMGASTGGVAALHDVFSLLPSNLPPIAIVQHMPEYYLERFAERLNDNSEVTVTLAKTGGTLQPGHAYVGPGDGHFLVLQKAGRLMAHIVDEEPFSGHLPSVDRLFLSAVDAVPEKTLAVIMTGMGKDGAKGMLALKEAGARTLGQNQASSVVYGMNKVAMEYGAVDREVDISAMAQTIVDLM